MIPAASDSKVTLAFEVARLVKSIWPRLLSKANLLQHAWAQLAAINDVNFNDGRLLRLPLRGCPESCPEIGGISEAPLAARMDVIFTAMVQVYILHRWLAKNLDQGAFARQHAQI